MVSEIIRTRFYRRTRPGNKIAHAEAWSIHVGIVMNGGNLSQETIIREQAKDNFFAKLKPGKYSSKCEIFAMTYALFIGANLKIHINCLYLKP